MSLTSTPTSPTATTSERAVTEAPLTLTTEPPRPLGFADQLALWGNLGISLFGPLTGALIATTAGSVGLVGVDVSDIAGSLRRHYPVRFGRSADPRCRTHSALSAHQ